MDLSKLQGLVALAEHGSIIRTSEALYLTPPLLHAFRRRYPELDLIVSTASARALAHALEAGDLEVAIVTSPELLDVPPAFAVLAEWSFEIGLAAHASRGLPPVVPLAALRAVPFVMRAEGSAFDRVTGAFFRGHGFRPHVIMRLDNANTVKTMVCSDRGVSMLPGWMLRGELTEWTLLLTRLTEGAVAATIAMAVRGRDRESRPVAAFTEFGLQWAGWDAQLTPTRHAAGR